MQYPKNISYWRVTKADKSVYLKLHILSSKGWNMWLHQELAKEWAIQAFGYSVRFAPDAPTWKIIQSNPFNYITYADIEDLDPKKVLNIELRALDEGMTRYDPYGKLGLTFSYGTEVTTEDATKFMES